MEQKAFELIQEKLQAALNEQGFGEAVALETDNGRGVMFTTGEVAYGLFYETKQRRFVLRSATMKTPKEPGDWRQLSMWLFDEGENTMQTRRASRTTFLSSCRALSAASSYRPRRSAARRMKRTTRIRSSFSTAWCRCSRSCATK